MPTFGASSVGCVQPAEVRADAPPRMACRLTYRRDGDARQRQPEEIVGAAVYLASDAASYTVATCWRAMAVGWHCSRGLLALSGYAKCSMTAFERGLNPATTCIR